MRELKKWNYETGQYEKYFIPKEWDVSIYESDFSRPVNCVQCGKKMIYGDSYTSKEVHTEIGFGYAVCGKCYEMEQEHERGAKKNDI